MRSPETRYATSGDVLIAYQVIGNGPIDLVFVPGFLSNLEVHWEDPGYSHLLARLSAFTRLIQFDKRGTGLSDRVDIHALPSLETRMDDVRAVMDALAVFMNNAERTWGTGASLASFAPGRVEDAHFKAWWAASNACR